MLVSDLVLEALSFIRSGDGFLTAMHDTAPLRAEEHHVAIFNPGSNNRQQSHLRLINPGENPAAVSISGIDDAGESPGEGVDVTIPPGASLTLTAQELSGEGRWQGLQGPGDGSGRVSGSSLLLGFNDPLVP